MYSSIDTSFGFVEPIVDQNSLLWLNDAFDQEGLAVFDLNRWANLPSVDLAGERYDAMDWSNTWNIPLEPSCLPDSPLFQTPLSKVAINNIDSTGPYSNSQNGAPHAHSQGTQPVPKSHEQNDLSRINKRPSALRTPHKVVERRYRNNLNAQIDLLASKLPKLANGSEDDPDSFPKAKSKANIMTSAISHIEALEENRVKSDAFVRVLEAQIAGLQKFLLQDESQSGMRSSYGWI